VIENKGFSTSSNTRGTSDGGKYKVFESVMINCDSFGLKAMIDQVLACVTMTNS
jgi:hypothetical protein